MVDRFFPKNLQEKEISMHLLYAVQVYTEYALMAVIEENYSKNRKMILKQNQKRGREGKGEKTK